MCGDHSSRINNKKYCFIFMDAVFSVFRTISSLSFSERTLQMLKMEILTGRQCCSS